MSQKQIGNSATTTRRGLLKATVVAAAASVFQPRFTIADEGAKGANKRIGVGLIGVGNRGTYHASIVHNLKAQGRCEHGGRVRRLYAPYRGARPKAVQDLSQPQGVAGRSAGRYRLHRQDSPIGIMPRRPSTPSAPARTCIPRNR